MKIIPPSSEFIEELLMDLESDRIERTVSTSNTDKFSEAICAFANDYPNHKQAGYLLIGVKDNGDLSGLKATDKLLLDLASVRTNGNILPQPALTINKYSFPEGDVAVVAVQPAVHPPVRYKGKVWIRTGPSKAVANETEEKRLIEKRTATAKTFDALPFWGTSIEDLDLTLFKNDYLQKAIDEETLIQNNRSIKQQLASLRFYDLNYDCPTNAGILCLGIDPIRFMPGAYIQYVKFNGVSITDEVMNEKQFKANLVTILRTLDEFIKYHLIIEKPVFKTILRQEKVLNYPYQALRELVMNALMHRNYESNSPIKLYEFSDRIEIQNSGGLYGEANIRNFPRVNDYRNPVLAEVIKNLGYVNRFNVGIANAEADLARQGNPPLVFDLSLETQFLVKIRAIQL